MSRIFLFISILFLTLISTGCSDTDISSSTNDCEGRPITLSVEAQLPELSFDSSASREFVDNPDIEYIKKLNIHVLLFDQSGAMLQYVKPANVTLISVDESTKTARFMVSNLMSGSNRTLHIIATSIADLSDTDHASGGENVLAMANENTTIANLIVKNRADAYWARETVERLDDSSELSVKLLRNFVKLNVRYVGPQSGFELLGYTVVNRPDLGTIAPFQFEDNYFAKFFDEKNIAIPYDDILASGYHGVAPAGIDNHLVNTTIEEIQAELDESKIITTSGEQEGEPVYFYERPQSGYLSGSVSDNLTFIIIKGRYAGKTCYYRIDIGDEVAGKFRFFDLLRNFQYTLRISEVGGEGMPTLEEALKNPAYNNLSTSVVTKDLFSIGYSGHTIVVNKTTAILTDGSDFDLKFKYQMTGTDRFDPSKLYIYDTTDDNDENEVNMTGLPKNLDNTNLIGDVIKSARLSGPDSDGWYTLTVTPNDAPSVGYLTQNIRIYYRAYGGLGRTVTFQRRLPWTINGLWHDNRAYTPDMSIPETSTITSALRKENANLYFRLPANLGESLFPLELLFESDKQNIYAHPEGPLTVETVAKSGFDGGSKQTVIAYKRRVEWTEYRDNASTGMWLVNPFLYNSTSDEDFYYPTTSIDNTGNPGRTDNNREFLYAVRISNPQGYINPVIDNIERQASFGQIDAGWTSTSNNTNTELPLSITLPLAETDFDLYYQLPDNIAGKYFGTDGLKVRISSSVALTATNHPLYNYTITSDDNIITQTIPYDAYLKYQNKILIVRGTLPVGASPVDINISTDVTTDFNGSIEREKWNMQDIRCTNTEYKEDMSLPSNVDSYGTKETSLTLCYLLPTGIPKEDFGEDGIKFTITCSREYLKESGSNPFNLTLLSASEATQIVTYEDYTKSRMIAAPFTLAAGAYGFTLTVTSDITNDITINLTRSRFINY